MALVLELHLSCKNHTSIAAFSTRSSLYLTCSGSEHEMDKIRLHAALRGD